jgi:hypothetical protein
MKRWAVLILLAGAFLAGGCAMDSSSGGASGEGPLASLPLGVIGQIEPVVLYPSKVVLEARIDTGATTSSIDARDIKFFERDRKRWVRFTLVNPKTKQRHTLEAPVARRVHIVEQDRPTQRRSVVELTIGLGKVVLKRQFSLVDRSGFSYPILLGRNVLHGQAAVDVSVSRTLKPEIPRD